MPALFLLALVVGYLLVTSIMEPLDSPRSGSPAIPARLFAAQFAAEYSKVRDSRGVPAEFAYAVASHECDAGRSNAYKRTFNAFSIHALAGDGKVNEFWRGATYTTGGGEVLRVYPSLSASISDFCKFLAERPFMRAVYDMALVRNAPGFFQAMQDSGYAGRPASGYAAALARRFKEWA